MSSESLLKCAEAIIETMLINIHEEDNCYENVPDQMTADNKKCTNLNLALPSIALDEFNGYETFLSSRDDSLQPSINDFKDNVKEISRKSELTNIIECEKSLLEERSYNDNECKFNVLTENLSNFNQEMALNDKKTDYLASVINFLKIKIKDANYLKDRLESHLNEAEHHVLMTRNRVENVELDLYSAQREYENVCTKIKCIINELNDLKSNDKVNENNLESCDVKNELFDPLIDYVHTTKLKLSELKSASDNEVWKGNCDSPLVSPDIGIDLEIDNLGDKMDLIKTLPKAKTNVENYVNKLQDQARKLSNKNIELVNYIALIENDLKEKYILVSKLDNELSEVKIQCLTLEEHNKILKEQIHPSLEIDTELRNFKKNLINEINILEPGKITNVISHLNLSNLLDVFVNLIITKEQQIITNLVDDHRKDKQQYKDQIKQFHEYIEKGKKQQELVESDNSKLRSELEILKSTMFSFINKVININESQENVLEIKIQSFDDLSELQDLLTQFNKMSVETTKKCEDLKEETEDLKRFNTDLGNECRCMLIEIRKLNVELNKALAKNLDLINDHIQLSGKCNL